MKIAKILKKIINYIDEYDLIFLAVFGISDSLSDGVKEAVRKCHKASVNVIMVTGDILLPLQQ